jgi:hypothetical protein
MKEARRRMADATLNWEIFTIGGSDAHAIELTAPLDDAP